MFKLDLNLIDKRVSWLLTLNKLIDYKKNWNKKKNINLIINLIMYNNILCYW